MSDPTGPRDVNTSFEEALRDLRQRAAQLDGLDTQISVMIQEVERTLAGLNLGIEFETEIWKSDDGKEIDRLLFKKYAGGNWRLVFERTEDGDRTGIDALLTNSSREQRAWAAAAIPKLLAGAASQVAERIKNREEVLAAMTDVLAVMRGDVQK